MPRLKTRVIDEHETMEPIFQKKTNFIITTLIILAVIIVAYISIEMVKRNRERKRIDEIVSSIQNEIYLKQCHLDKMYCCGYKDKTACDNWIKANCSEEDGSLEIDCSKKF